MWPDILSLADADLPRSGAAPPPAGVRRGTLDSDEVCPLPPDFTVCVRYAVRKTAVQQTSIRGLCLCGMTHDPEPIL